MTKNRITSSFRLFSLCSVLCATVLSKLFQILYVTAASDVTVSDILAYLSQGAFEIFSLFAIAMALSASVYAHSYFGKKTAIRTSLISLGCLALGKVIMYIYNILVNELSAAQLISGALSYITEILFDALIIILAVIFSFTFAKKRARSGSADGERGYSPTKAAFAAAGAYFFILTVDLTCMNVIPFFTQYDDPTASEIKSIVADYLYYVFKFPLTLFLILLSVFLLTKVTGKLRLKQYYESKTSKE